MNLPLPAGMAGYNALTPAGMAGYSALTPAGMAGYNALTPAGMAGYNALIPAGMAGYNAGPGFHPSNAFAIHHPGGNAKRISFVNDTCACVPI